MLNINITTLKILQGLSVLYIFLSLVLGNEIKLLSIDGLRLSQLLLLVSLPLLAILCYQYKLYKKTEFLLLFLFICYGLIQAYLGWLDFQPVRFILANYGMFAYSLFMVIGYLVITKENYWSFFNLFLFAALLGIVFFVLRFYLEEGRLPYLMRVSSDPLPAMAAALISALVVLIMSYRGNLNYLWWIIPLILFSLLMLVKGAVLGILVTILILGFIQYVRIVLFFLICMFGIGVLYLVSHHDALISSAQSGDIFWANIMLRYYAFRDMLSILLDGGADMFWGHGLIPLQFDLTNTPIKTMSVSDCSGVVHTNPHNSYLLMIYYSGLFGLSLFGLILFKVIKLAVLNKHIEYVLFTPMVLCFLILAMTTPVMELHYLAPFFWLWLGFILKTEEFLDTKY